MKEFGPKAKPQSRMITITPLIATFLLTLNTGNRPVSRHRLAKLVTEFLNGEFVLNGASIVISKSGRLLDGQHRLMACVESGVSFQVILAEGVDDDAFCKIDIGGRRTLGDTLAVMGVKYPIETATTLVMVDNYESYGRPVCRWSRHNNADIVALHELYPEANQSACRFTKRRGPLPAASWAWCDWLFRQKSAEHAQYFMSRLITGENLTAGDPILVLRDRIDREMKSERKKTVRDDVFRTLCLALTVRAWNAYRENRKVSKLQWIDDEEFPKVV